MILLEVVLLGAAITFGFFTLFSIVMRLCVGRFPAPFYGLVFAWWWPIRRDSALTIAASLFDGDEDCEDWMINSGYCSTRYTHRKTQIEVRFEDDAGFGECFSSVRMGGEKSGEDSWGVYALCRAVKAWNRRRRSAEIDRADRRAAEAVMRAYRK